MNLQEFSTIIEQHDIFIQKIINKLSKKVTKDGSISTALMDQNQKVYYDLAWAASLLFTSKEALNYASKYCINGEDIIEAKLTKFFIAEAIYQLHSLFLPHLQYIELPNNFYESIIDITLVKQVLNNIYTESFAETIVEDLNQDFFGEVGLSDDQKIMVNSFSAFAKDKVEPIAEKIHREDLDIPSNILDGLKELGCFGLSIPEKFGGFQPNLKEDNMSMIIITEELSKASVGVAGSLITRPEIVAKALLAGGTEEQQEKWLPKFALGKTLPAIAVTEPDYGSDVANIKLSATKLDSGDWILNGTKTWCTFAGRANVLLVLARTNPNLALNHKGLSLFLVEKDAFDGHSFTYTQKTGGSITGSAISTIGYRGMHSFEVVFENVCVPHENLLGLDNGIGKGFYIQMAGFAGGRLQTAARAIGVMQSSLEKALSYANERKVFKQSIVNYGLTKFKLAKMASLIQIIRQATYKTAQLMDDKKGMLEVSLIKFFSCRISEWVSREAMQIHGGMGYAEEYAVSRYFLDSRIFTIFEGAEEVLALRVIAKSLLNLTQNKE